MSFPEIGPAHLTPAMFRSDSSQTRQETKVFPYHTIGSRTKGMGRELKDETE